MISWLICGTDKITPTEFLLWVQFDPQVVCWIKVRKMSSAPLSLSSLTFFLTSLSYKRIYNFSMFSFSQSPFFFVLFTFVFITISLLSVSSKKCLLFTLGWKNINFFHPLFHIHLFTLSFFTSEMQKGASCADFWPVYA